MQRPKVERQSGRLTEAEVAIANLTSFSEKATKQFFEWQISHKRNQLKRVTQKWWIANGRKTLDDIFGNIVHTVHLHSQCRLLFTKCLALHCLWLFAVYPRLSSCGLFYQVPTRLRQYAKLYIMWSEWDYEKADEETIERAKKRLQLLGGIRR